MPRAGSELLQVILHQNPRIYASTTSPLLEYQFAARTNYDIAEVRSQDPSLMQKAFIAMCRGMADSYYSALTNRPVICDKNRGWSHYYEWVQQWNPDPKIICMVRDLRSILASMERIYRKNRHRPTGPDNPTGITNMTVSQRCGHWLHTQPVGLALQRLVDLFQRKLNKNVLILRYEDLCNNSQTVMDRIYDFIGEEKFTHNFNKIEKQIVEDDSHFGVYGQHSVLPEIRPVKPKDWEELLPPDVAEGVRRDNAWYFSAFGY